MAQSEILSNSSAPNHVDREVDDVEKDLYESFGEVAALAANLLRDWSEDLGGQHNELRRLTEDIAVHLPTCHEEITAAGEKILLNASESWLKDPFTITECINPGAPVPRPVLLQRDNGAPVPIEQTFAHASNQMPLNRRRLFQEGAAYRDEPFDLRFESSDEEEKVVGQPGIFSFEPTPPPGAPPILAKHLVHDANGDFLTVMGKLTAEDRVAILSGEWTIMRTPSELYPQALPSRAVAGVQGFNSVLFRPPNIPIPTSSGPTPGAEVSIPSTSFDNSSVAHTIPPAATLSSPTHNSTLPTSSPLFDHPAPPQEVKLPSRSPCPPKQPVDVSQTASSFPPSTSLSSYNHVFSNPSNNADSHRSLKRTSSSDVGPNPDTLDRSTPANGALGEPTKQGSLKRGHTSGVGHFPDDAESKSPKRQRGLDGQLRQPPAAISGTASEYSPQPKSESSGPSSQERSGVNGTPPGRHHPTRHFKPMLPYEAKTGRELRREGAFIEKDFGEYVGWFPNPLPQARLGVPTLTSNFGKSPRPLKRTGAVIGFEVGNRTKWFPPPPPGGFYCRPCSYPPSVPTTTTTPVKPSSSSGLGPFAVQGLSASNDVQTPPSTHPAPSALSEGIDSDDSELEYVDDPSPLAPPIAATTIPSAPSRSWVPPPFPETPTPVSRTRKRIGAIGESAPVPRVDTRKRSRDDNEDEDESLRPRARIRSSDVPHPGPSRHSHTPLPPPLHVPLVGPPASAISFSSASPQTATTTIIEDPSEALPLRRSSRLAKRLRK